MPHSLLQYCICLLLIGLRVFSDYHRATFFDLVQVSALLSRCLFWKGWSFSLRFFWNMYYYLCPNVSTSLREELLGKPPSRKARWSARASVSLYSMDSDKRYSPLTKFVQGYPHLGCSCPLGILQSQFCPKVRFIIPQCLCHTPFYNIDGICLLQPRYPLSNSSYSPQVVCWYPSMKNIANIPLAL